MKLPWPVRVLRCKATKMCQDNYRKLGDVFLERTDLQVLLNATVSQILEARNSVRWPVNAPRTSVNVLLPVW